MKIEYLIFPAYLLVGFWLIPKIAFIKNANLTAIQTRLLLTLKILSGFAGAFYFEKKSTNVDYISLNTAGKIEYELLLSNPKLFFTDFKHDINLYGLGGLFDSQNSFWAYLRFNLLHKFIAILDLLTKGNFYFNSVIFSSAVFFGHFAFYRIYSDIYKGHKLKTVFACFFLPSLLLYTCCVHKDGMIFVSLGITSYIIYQGLSSRYSINIKYILLFLMGITTIFLFRNYVVVAIIPAMSIALLCKILPYKKRFVFPATYSFFLVLFFLSGYSKSFFNLPDAVVQRKADFAGLGQANTNIPMYELHPTLQSFLVNLPQAVNHYLFRPYLWEFRQPAVLLTALELFMYQLIIVIFVFYRLKPLKSAHPFNIFGLSVLINMMLIVGYTIPNVGAIVRYRSIFWLFLICPLLCNIDWKRLFSFRKTVTNTF